MSPRARGAIERTIKNLSRIAEANCRARHKQFARPCVDCREEHREMANWLNLDTRRRKPRGGYGRLRA